MSKQFIVSAIIALSLAFACHQDLNAQTTKRDTAFHKHWEVGVDLLALFDKNNVPASTLFFRKNYFQKNEKGRAWRFRVGVDAERRTYDDIGRVESDSLHSINPYFSIGHEWQSVQTNYKWFVGTDLFASPFYGKYHSLVLGNISEVNDDKNWDIKAGLSGRVGFQVFLTKQISLSIESNATLGYNYWRYMNYQHPYDLPIDAGSFGDSKDKRINFKILPIQAVHLAFSLNKPYRENAKTPKRDTMFHKHCEVGVDLLALFDKNNVPAGSVFFRNNYFQEKGRGRAWRFRVGAAAEDRDFVGAGEWVPGTFKHSDLYLSIGHEWQSVHQHYRWFAGGDLFASGYFGKSYFLYSLTDSAVADEKIRDYKIGLSGFVGFQVFLTKQIAISVESNLGVTYLHFYESGYYTRFDAPIDSGGHGVTIDNKLKIGVKPIHIIQLSYKLNNFHHEIKRI